MARLKVVIINKSDSLGGAAVVSMRLLNALCNKGVEAHMLVTDRRSDSPLVEMAGPKWKIKWNFLLERLLVFILNCFNIKTLFNIDPAITGLPLWKNRRVKEADAIILGWVNQGMLSLKGIKKIQELGKPVIWTMHDMWCMTGICHHAGSCTRFHENCGCCPLLGIFKSKADISRITWNKKNTTYGKEINGKLGDPVFGAVSNWLAQKGRESRLLRHRRIEVIPNPFHLEKRVLKPPFDPDRITIVFGAARLDDPIKGLDILIDMTRVLAADFPEIAAKARLITFGGIKNPALLDEFAISHRHLGMVRGEKEIRKIYEEADILVSSSSYESLPGTLVEAQAYGCVPVSFNQGGQSDIVTHLSTGYLADWGDNPELRPRKLAEGVAWAVSVIENENSRAEIVEKMRRNVMQRFEASAVAQKYIDLIRDLQMFH